MRERHIRRLKLISRAQLLLLQLTLTSKDFSRVTGVISVYRLRCTLVSSPTGLHQSLTHVGKYYICTHSCQPEYSTVRSFRGNCSTVHFSALYSSSKASCGSAGNFSDLWSKATHFLSGWCHLGIMPKLPWTKNVHAWGQWHVRICKPLLFNTSLSCFPVCVSVFSEESFEDLFHQRSKVFKAAMWSHAKMILITVFLFG